MTATDGRTVNWVSRRHEGSTQVRLRWAFPLISIASVLALWWGVTAAQLWSDLILPSPSKVWDAFIQSVTVHDGRTGLSGYYLWDHLWASLWRITKGLVYAIIIGVPLGLALGVWNRFELLLGPIVSFLRSLPPLGYFSLLIIWFGIDDTSKVWLLFIAAFAPIALAVANGVSSARIERLNASLVLGASNFQVIRYVIAPSVMPDFIIGVRIAVGFAWTTIVAAETSNGIPGIGGLAWATKKELRSDVAILCIIVIGATAVLLDAILRRAERHFASWHGRA